MADGVRLVDGQLSFSGGVQSSVPRTKKVEGVPDGVAENQLCWGLNISVRGGGISQRAALEPVVKDVHWPGLYQGGLLYQPDFTDPILILLIGGRFYRIRVDTDYSVTDLTSKFGVGMPATAPMAHFTQGEMFGIVQAGDFVTKPVFYDFGIEGIRPETMRFSNGLVTTNPADPLFPTNELPPAGPMDYYGQRVWYAFGRSYGAGDIAGNRTSGSIPYDYRDSILHLTENPVAYAGDGFAVPTQAGNIRALSHASNIDTALGQSSLFVFTRRAVYACEAPTTRQDWTAATNDLQPLQKVALRGGGSYGDRCIVPVNGDLFFAGPPNGDIRSMQTAVRWFGTWGSVPLSNNLERALAFNNRELLAFSSGINFDNRMLMATLPINTPVGIACQAVMPLDFDVISTLEERRPPAWEGLWDLSGGPQVLQMFEGDFGGRQRGFMVVWSNLRQQIEVWEIRPDLLFDNGDNRMIRVIEYPAYTSKSPFQLKELVGGEMWIDRVIGTTEFTVEYRPDGNPCWFPWHAFKVCVARDCHDNSDQPCYTGYPVQFACPEDMVPISLPKPPDPSNMTNQSPSRASTWGYQFQARLTIKGPCRVRGFLMHAFPRARQAYSNIVSEPPESTL